jgi:hypothetical protein
MPRRTSRPAILTAALMAWTPAGCSDRPTPESAAKPNRRLDEFRVVPFAKDKVVVPFRKGLPKLPVPPSTPREVAKVGDRVALGDSGEGEVFLALDLEALQFYHSTPGPDQIERFRTLGDEGRLFVVARGTAATVTRVVVGELPDGLKAIELELDGPKGAMAWASDPFVHRVEGVSR